MEILKWIMLVVTICYFVVMIICLRAKFDSLEHEHSILKIKYRILAGKYKIATGEDPKWTS
jgi:hypothetical protein